jgi:mannose/cellobiose epimerase-like protein (N-acyl-D-glucosamine 2-epimerase family)
MHADLIATLERWLFDDCLPFWRANAWDAARGGFVEEFLLDGRDAGRPTKRLRVAPRQIYVFSHAALLGVTDCEPLIAQGAEWLTTHGFMKDKAAFAHVLTRDGAISDATIDLYDHAFCLFGFAWAYAATGDAAYRDWAERTLDAIEAHLSAPGGAFLSNPAGQDRRDQNPHMHLLEASLAAHDAFGDDRYAILSRSIVRLGTEHFMRQGGEVLLEHFGPDFAPAPGEAGRRVEPGHMFEWAWLLHHASDALGENQDDRLVRLATAAERMGVNAAGLVSNACDIDGRIIDATSRSWPNTERLKAGVALMERGAASGAGIANGAADALIRYYLAPQDAGLARGLWMERRDGAGGVAADAVPASILYHLMVAITEAMRWRRQSAS